MAMHYNTNDKLKADLNASLLVSNIASSDVLSPATDYTAYIFSAEQIIQSINFTTLAIPAAADWGAEGATAKFVDGSFPYRDNEYQLYAKLGELLLVPVFYHNNLAVGLLYAIDGVTVVTCTTTSCVPATVSGDEAESVLLDEQYTSTQANTYNSPVFGIRQTRGTSLDLRDGPEEVSTINLLY